MSRRWFHSDITSYEAAAKKLLHHKSTKENKKNLESTGGEFLVHKIKNDTSRLSNLSVPRPLDSSYRGKVEVNYAITAYLCDFPYIPRNFNKNNPASYAIKTYFREEGNSFCLNKKYSEKYEPIIHIPIYQETHYMDEENSKEITFKYFLNDGLHGIGPNSLTKEDSWDSLTDLIDYYSVGGNGESFIKNFAKTEYAFGNDRWIKARIPNNLVPTAKLRFPIYNNYRHEKAPYFHPKIKGIQVENKLKLQQYPLGSFLLRYSEKDLGAYSLAIKLATQNNEIYIHHSRISSRPARPEDALERLSKRGGNADEDDEIITLWSSPDIKGKQFLSVTQLIEDPYNEFQILPDGHTIVQPGDSQESLNENIIKHKLDHSKMVRSCTINEAFNFKRDLTNRLKEAKMVQDPETFMMIKDPKFKNSESYKNEYDRALYEHMIKNSNSDNENLHTERKNWTGFIGHQPDYEHVSKVTYRRAENTKNNNRKNRYNNIVPFDHSRVLLKYGMVKSYESARLINDKKQIDLSQLMYAKFDTNKFNYDNKNSDTGGDHDYINASTIGRWGTQNRGRTYIAAQGPIGNPGQIGIPTNSSKIDTVVDFWRLVVSSGTYVVVMLTNCVESHRNKCAKYWPKVGSSETHSNKNKEDIITVENLSEESKASDNYIIRRLRLTCHFRDELAGHHGINDSNSPNSSNSKDKIAGFVYDIVQYHYVKWPDHGAPTDSQPVIDMLKDIHGEHEQWRINPDEKLTPNENYSKGARGKNNPILVHCSAGVGRTGSIIALDMLMDKIRWCGLETDLNIYDTLLALRERRVLMVQTAVQYKFIYEALLAYIKEVRKGEDYIQEASSEEEPEDENDRLSKGRMTPEGRNSALFMTGRRRAPPGKFQLQN